MEELDNNIRSLQKQIDRLILAKSLINDYYKKDAESLYKFEDITDKGELYVARIEGTFKDLIVLSVENFNSLESSTKQAYSDAYEIVRLHRIAEEWGV
jgi:hypothetical protein